MISLDMKYTSLYWALGYVEEELDIHIKKYLECDISIYAEKQSVDYGNLFDVRNPECKKLIRHKDFVILECIDRLLMKGYTPSEIIIDGKEGQPDIFVNDLKIYCCQWGSEYINTLESIEIERIDNGTIIYTSRLVSGLLEYKNIIIVNKKLYNYGLFEENIQVHELNPIKAKSVEIESSANIEDFEINEDELIRYNGKSKIVKVPEGITTIGASAFWDCIFIEEVILPDSLIRIGGDAFYYCKSLKNLTITQNVRILGNNPFAGCPNLKITNSSLHFNLIDGVLYNYDFSNLIHYTISKTNKYFSIPNGVKCLGKHSFYDCKNIEQLTIPETVVKFENNPFSGCENLKIVENKSKYYIIENGIIYNKFKTTIIGCLNTAEILEYVIPDSVTAISRNSFWNCNNVEKIIISKSIKRIGYNPFAGCKKMQLKSNNPMFIVENGILYNNDFTQIICCPKNSAKGYLKIRNSVKTINRSAFNGCTQLIEIDFNNVSHVDKSAFTNCTLLSIVHLCDKLEYIGEWAFAYCINLRKIDLRKQTVVDKNAFSNSNVELNFV